MVESLEPIVHENRLFYHASFGLGLCQEKLITPHNISSSPIHPAVTLTLSQKILPTWWGEFFIQHNPQSTEVIDNDLQLKSFHVKSLVFNEIYRVSFKDISLQLYDKFGLGYLFFPDISGKSAISFSLDLGLGIYIHEFFGLRFSYGYWKSFKGTEYLSNPIQGHVFLGTVL